MTAATEVNNGNEVICLGRIQREKLLKLLFQKSGSEYPTGENEVEDILMTELTMDELKTAFRLVERFFLKGEQVPVV